MAVVKSDKQKDCIDSHKPDATFLLEFLTIKGKFEANYY